MGIFSEKFYTYNTDSLLADILNTENAYYVFLGRIHPWPDDTSPPTPNNCLEEYELSIYQDIVFGKLIGNNNVQYMVPRTDWISGQVYAQYDPNDGTMFGNNFFVFTNTGDVYKCIDNNKGSPSTITPALKSATGPFQTSDGYTWKYLYTVAASANQVFTSNNYIPVTANAAVMGNAIPGTIDVCRVKAGGEGWVTSEGFLQSVVNSSVIQIAADSSAFDNFYVGSSIYFKAGIGAGQIGEIVNYSADDQLITVSPPIEFFETLNIANVNGTIISNNVVLQVVDIVNFVFQSGFFNVGDTLVQSDTQYTGQIITANTTVFTTDNQNFNIFSNSFPIFSTTTSNVKKSGTVNISAGSNTITANSGTAFTTDYAVGKFICVGPNANTNVRRITGVNSSVIQVATNFQNSLLGANNYLVVNAIDSITSEAAPEAEGIVTEVLLSGIEVTYENVSSNSLSFIIGEEVKEFNQVGIDQFSNATVAYANSSTLVLSNVNGTFNGGNSYYVIGQSSGLQAWLETVIDYPNIVVSSTGKNFLIGQKLYFFDQANLSFSTANAVLDSLSTIPDNLTEYIISPTVNISGDGNNALAYCVANTTNGSLNEITNVVMINPGNNYSFANVSITANSFWGNGAVINPIISPVHGHGYNPVKELGATFAQISVIFDTQANESYKFPAYGEYRRIGLIRNPQFASLTVNVADFERLQLTVASTANTFIEGEIVLQPQSNAAGVIVFANSTFIELDEVSGTFIANTANDNIYGLVSTASANVKVTNTVFFTAGETATEINSKANGLIANVSGNNTQLVLTNITGLFTANDILYCPTVNAIANVVSLMVANGTANTSTFGMRFNQTARVTLTSNTGTYHLLETVTQSNGVTGVVLDDAHELDLVVNVTGGSFSNGTLLTDANTNANGTIIFANSTYLQITSVDGTFAPGDSINTLSGNGTVTNVYSVLVLQDVYGTFATTGNTTIVGANSGAFGVTALPNTNYYPDLIRNTGAVLYIDDMKPVTLSANSTEQFTLVINF